MNHLPTEGSAVSYLITCSLTVSLEILNIEIIFIFPHQSKLAKATYF